MVPADTQGIGGKCDLCREDYLCITYCAPGALIFYEETEITEFGCGFVAREDHPCFSEGAEILEIAINIKACFGCRTCELVCSFHHAGVFSPELSSIGVIRCNRTGKVEWSVDSTCDSCIGEVKPLCVNYCQYGALKEVGRS